MKRFPCEILSNFLSVFSLILFIGQSHASTNDIATRLKALTGSSRVKVIFTRDTIAQSDDFPPSNDFYLDQVLVGFDTDLGKEDTLQSTMANYQNPLITHNGARIVYTQFKGDRLDPAHITMTTYVTAWGKDSVARKVVTGMTACLWYDPALNKEYVIYSNQVGGGNVYKRDIDDTLSDTLVLSGKHPITQWLRISQDGKAFAGCFGAYEEGASPMKVIRRADDSEIVYNAGGCWPTMPYDTTKRLVKSTDNHNSWAVMGTNDDHASESPDKTMIGMFSELRMASWSPDIFLIVVNALAGQNGTGDIKVVKTDASLLHVLDTVTVTPANDWGNCHYADLWASPLPAATAMKPWVKTASRFGGNSPTYSREIFTLSGKRVSGERFVKGFSDLPPGVYISVDRVNNRIGRVFSARK